MQMNLAILPEAWLSFQGQRWLLDLKCQQKWFVITLETKIAGQKLALQVTLGQMISNELVPSILNQIFW